MTMTDAIGDTLDRYMEAFNGGDLDGVMRYFADHAIYCPGDGLTHRGHAAIRAAFTPQFTGSMGTMRFDEHDRLIDGASGKAAIRWTCRHDLAGFKAHSPGNLVQRVVVGLVFGSRFGWEGMDVFHFDEAGSKIIKKFTYANYRRVPHLRRDLGRPGN